VNPATAARDLPVLKGLAGLGHAEMGVYAKVVSGGRVERGATLEFID
jgi:MOSC domain-containing protein YiiM